MLSVRLVFLTVLVLCVRLPTCAFGNDGHEGSARRERGLGKCLKEKYSAGQSDRIVRMCIWFE